MGGGGSNSNNQLQNPAPGSHNDYTSSNFDPGMIDAFASTDMGKKYTPFQITQLRHATNVKEGPNSLGDVSGLDNRVIDQGFLAAFNSYRKDQENAGRAWQSYATLVGQQGGGGGQQTIIGSPATFAAPAPAIGANNVRPQIK